MFRCQLCSWKNLNTPLNSSWHCELMLQAHESFLALLLIAWFAFHLVYLCVSSPILCHPYSDCIVCCFERGSCAARKVTREDLIPPWLLVNSFLDIRMGFMSPMPYAIWNTLTCSLELLLLPSVGDFLCAFSGTGGFSYQKSFYKVSFKNPILTSASEVGRIISRLKRWQHVNNDLHCEATVENHKSVL